ncbi:hypothetical protein C8Q78DRAFT_1076361 [Trametes maxima]|nr:hypothetical protein C8Q78DRAFT_1076361 [Trametes maxima]
MSDVDDGEYVSPSQTQTQFVPRDDDDEQMWDVEEILEESGKRYKVRWKDTRDENTGKMIQWPSSWVDKHDCTDELIAAWKRQKEMKRRKAMAKKLAKDPPFNASSKSKKRSESTSTAATTRRSRRNTHESLPSTSVHPLSETIKPRASTSRTSRGPNQSKRRQADSGSNDAQHVTDLSPRPRKRRKVEVEIVLSSSRHSVSVPKSAPKTVTRKRFGKDTLLSESLDDEDSGNRSDPRNKEQAGDVKANTAAGAVPLSKVGPPRGVKRSRAGKKHDIASPHGPDPSSSREGEVRHRPPPPANGTQTTRRGTSSSHRTPEDTTATSRSHSSRAPAELVEDSDSGDEELSYTNTFTKVLKLAKTRLGSLSAETRGLLAQEEEEDTQEAAGFVPALSPPDARQYRPLSVEHRPSRIDKPPPSNGKYEPSQSNGKSVMQARTSVNDTFSREGIVPETQPIAASHSSPDQTHRSSQSPDVAVDRDLPSTPPHARMMQRPSIPRSASSVKSKMKRKRRSMKGLRPIPRLSPSVFHPHLPPADDDEIDQFSSPEKDTRRKAALTLDPFTQDTIEAAEFAQEQADAFVDWDGGVAPDGSLFTDDDEGNGLSLGPDLPAPNGPGGPRRAMNSMFAERQATTHDPPTKNPITSGTPIQQEPPLTSSTQRAEADSQSQLELHGQIVELHAILAEKEEQLVQAEGQLEKLQVRLKELEAEKAQGTADFEAKLKALQSLSDDKSEQISQLESQLVELQLQLTQITSEIENERAQHESRIRGLNETLEERNEQVSQLECALVELQTEVAEMAAENEKLTAAQELASANDHAGKLSTAQQRVAALEQELASAHGQLSEAQQEATTLTARLESTAQDWERRFKYAESDRDLFKNLYSEASTHAARLAQENAELEERAKLAESQVRDGLAMVRGTFEGQVQKLREEVAKWQGLCKVLQEKDERTDDEVRRRAALEPELREENERLLREAEIVRSDMEKMAGIIALMSERRGKSEDAMDEDYQDEGDALAKGGMNDQSGLDGVPSLPGFLTEDTDDTEKYGCQQVCDAMMCRYMFSTVQELIQHVRQVHYPDVENFEQ